MKYEEFIGQVQSRGRMASQEEAVRATRATLETLSERLYGGETGDLASQLPREIARFLDGNKENRKYDVNEFFHKVLEREGVSMKKSDAVFHTRAVFSVLGDAVDPGEMEDIKSQLPREYETLFASGSEGSLEL